jgi:predicted anti-sigma-YlaC factor YlaD
MQHWFDSSHGTPELGRLVLARVDAALDGRAQGEPLFGVALDARNVEAHLAECRSARDAWRAANREERVWISNVIHDDRLLRLLPPFARR